MKIENLVYFSEVVKSQSIAKAAENLFISPQGLSKAVRHLEEEFHVPLFVRDGGNVYLTKEGKVFYSYAADIIEIYNRMYSRMSELSLHTCEKAGAPITLYATPYLIQRFFFHKEIKKRIGVLSGDVYLYERLPKDMLTEIHGMADSSVNAINIPDYRFEDIMSDKNIVYEHLFDAILMVSVSATSPLARRKSMNKDELYQYSLAIYGDGMMVEMLDHLLPDKARQKIRIQTTGGKIINECVGRNEAIGFTDSFLETFYPNERFVGIPIRDSVVVHHGFLYSSINPPCQQVIEYIQTVKQEFLHPAGSKTGV